MGEVRRIEIDGPDGTGWRWHDPINHDRGNSTIPLQGLAAGDALVVEVHRKGNRWIVDRVVQAPDSTWVRDESPVDDPGAAATEQWMPGLRSSEPVVGEVRTTFERFTSYRTAAHDAGRTQKNRPCIVIRVDDANEEVVVRCVYDVSSARRKQGLARKLQDWRQAGLHKPCVVATEEVVRRFDQVGPTFGTISDTDWAWLIGGRRRS